MPLKIVCPKCGAWVFVKQMDDERKGFRLWYDCAKCNTVDGQDWIDKRTW